MGKQPVIILGMGRSGSSMLSRLLESLGLFVGHNKRGGNNESWFFYRLNDWMLKCANATWDNPHNFNFIDDAYREDFSRVAIAQMKSLRRNDYLGWDKFFKYRDMRDIDFPWGWKDPRNTFTIDVWKEIFPDCKVVHIYRHPMDSAESARYGKEVNKAEKVRNWRWKVREYFLLRVGYQLSARTGYIEEAVKLWEEYLTKSLAWNDVFGDNIYHVRYESLLDNPIPVMKELLDFIDMPVSDEKLAETVKHIRTDRKFAFLENKKLVKIYEGMRDNDLMKKLGYSDIG